MMQTQESNQAPACQFRDTCRYETHRLDIHAGELLMVSIKAEKPFRISSLSYAAARVVQRRSDAPCNSDMISALECQT